MIFHQFNQIYICFFHRLFTPVSIPKGADFCMHNFFSFRHMGNHALSSGRTELIKFIKHFYECILLPPPHLLADFFSVSNSSLDFPWRKVTEGEQRFRDIVETHDSVSSRETLTEELFTMMVDNTKYSKTY